MTLRTAKPTTRIKQVVSFRCSHIQRRHFLGILRAPIWRKRWAASYPFCQTWDKRTGEESEIGLGLERFVRREALRRVHEYVFAVLALESEPVDPRL